MRIYLRLIGHESILNNLMTTAYSAVANKELHLGNVRRNLLSNVEASNFSRILNAADDSKLAAWNIIMNYNIYIGFHKNASVK